jgi:chemotaxis protein methyltransferase CheR
MQPKNIMLNIVSDYLNQTLVMRYDICQCPQCRADIIAYVLSRIPAKYVTTDAGAISAVAENSMVENEAEIIKQILKALEVIGKKPHHESKVTVKEDKDEAFRLLIEHIYKVRGVDFRGYLPRILKRRVARRMDANKVDTYADYLRVLVSSPREYDMLFDNLTINITEFFRDKTVFKAAEMVLAKMIRHKIATKDTNIKVWSAGCASGEEPYSIAILLKELTRNDELGFNIKIIATDIDRESLATARLGEYEPKSLKNLSKIWLKKHLEPVGSKYRVKDKLKELITFYHHNLVSDQPFENIDVIFCRNVFIFFNREVQEHLVINFHKALKKDGYMVLGKVETFLGEAKELFRVINFDERIFQKI